MMKEKYLKKKKITNQLLFKREHRDYVKKNEEEMEQRWNEWKKCVTNKSPNKRYHPFKLMIMKRKEKLSSFFMCQEAFSTEQKKKN